MRWHEGFVKILVLCLLSCLTAASAAAEIPNLNALERSVLGSLVPQDATGTVQGPSRFVAPGLKVVETTRPLDTTPGSRAAIRDALLMSRPFGDLSTSATNAVLVNGDFEEGTFNGWTLEGRAGTGNASVCGGPLPPDARITHPGLMPFALNDPNINFAYGSVGFSAMLGDSLAWGYAPSTEPQCNIISQTASIPAGTATFTFAYAVLASNPGHGVGQDPYFQVRVEDLTAGTVLYDVIDYTTSYNPLNPCLPWCLGGVDPLGGSRIVYRTWTEVDLDLSGIPGHLVKVSLKASDCSPSGHFCEAFLDGLTFACPDTVAPATVQLSAECDPGQSADFCATLQWLAPADPSQVPDADGQNCLPVTEAAMSYDVRWSTAPILTDADFAAANLATGEPTPAAPGTPETFVVCGLPQATIYFALQSQDSSLKKSDFSLVTVDCPSNDAPICSTAVACQPVLWPPNHKLQPVTICGVTDPDGDPVTLTVTSITQDEPINTRGDGSTCPDAQIVDGQASVRAERTGTPGIPGNGRVYTVHFTADDGNGGQCTGSVTVCVPHDDDHPTCVDDGQRYDALASCRIADSSAPETAALAVGSVTGQQAQLTFAMPQAGTVEIAAFDVSGRRIATIVSEAVSGGVYERTWKMGDLEKGVYFVRMQAPGVKLTKTVIKMR